MAGINAHKKVKDIEGFTLGRSEAYIGVLIDDLVTKGTDEPYRMFTSRAEYRILLRQDNADLRLTEKGHAMGLASDERMKRVEEKTKATKAVTAYLENESVTPETINRTLEANNSSAIKQKTKLAKILSRPQIKVEDFLKINIIQEKLNEFEQEAVEQAEIQIKYNGYIAREEESAQKLNKLEGIKIPENFNFSKLGAISSESREKLSAIRPKSIGQASRISGITPAAINILMVYIKKNEALIPREI